MYYKDLTWQKCSKSMLSQKGEKQISGIVFHLVFCWEWQGRQHCYIYYPSHFLQQVLLHCGLIETLSNLQHQAPPSHKRRLEHGVQTIPGRAACDLSVSVLRTSLTLHWKHHNLHRTRWNSAQYLKYRQSCSKTGSTTAVLPRLLVEKPCRRRLSKLFLWLIYLQMQVDAREGVSLTLPWLIVSQEKCKS